MESRENSKLIRAFICIDFPDDVVKEIARVQEILSGVKFAGKLTELENLHLTLKFLGEIDEDKLGKVKEKLREIKFGEMELKLGGMGMFASHGNPRIVWIKIDGGEIWELQKKIDSKMNEMGFKLEERFMSHLTIARLKYVKDKKEFKKYIDGIGVKEIKFKVDRFRLMRSDLKPMGPVYTMIEEYKSN